jgi:hypothetical protein
MKALGKLQSNVLSALIEHKGWQERCGWVYSSTSKTKSVLDSLVKRKFVRCEDGFYTPIQDEKGNKIISTVTKG